MDPVEQQPDTERSVERSASSQRLAAAVVHELKRQAARPLEPGVYLVATPIGNLADITLRALHVLAHCDVIYCEDTRVSARLMQHYAIGAPLKAFHDHNEEDEIPRIIDRVAKGARVAVVPDAGTPLVSDPGFKLVRACVAGGVPVTSLPGPSALLAGLAASGLPTDQFTFAGFLPPKQSARRARLAGLLGVPGTLVFFEAPQRLSETLADMAHVLGERAGAVGRELTKLHEELARGSLGELAGQFAAREVKGEAVILAGPPLRREAGDEDIAEALKTALDTMRLKDAAAAVADALGVQKSRVYALGLKLKDKER